MTVWTGLKCSYCGRKFGILVPSGDAERDLRDKKAMDVRPCPSHDPPRSNEEVDIIQWDE